MFLEATVFTCFATVGWVYVGYPASMALWARRLGESKPTSSPEVDLPSISLVIPAWNEQDYVFEKVRNTHALRYPPELLDVIWVTDGSDDNSPEMLSSLGQFVMHQPERKGKAAAINRAIPVVHSDIVVFTDANTILHPDTLRAIADAFVSTEVGCVSGCKRVTTHGYSSGEGLYWKYEHHLKRWESRVHSTMGAPGELVAFRNDQLRPLDENAILDDFVMSMSVIKNGKRLAYVPNAIAQELPSANASADLERRARITAGGLQSLWMLSDLLDPRVHPQVAYCLLSHRLLRWTAAPLATLLLPPVLVALAATQGGVFWTLLASIQCVALVLATGQSVVPAARGPIRFLHFFYLANVAAILGWIRFMRQSQSSSWVRVVRAKDERAATRRAS